MKNEEVEKLKREQKQADRILEEKESLRRKIGAKERRGDITRRSSSRMRIGLKDTSSVGTPILVKKS